MQSKKAILLINLGTPDSTKVPDVRKYLRQFLMDGRVIDIPFVNRWMLINFIIAPFRAPKSAAEYEKLFTDEGSPLKFHTQKLTKLLSDALGSDYIVDFAMRYQSPSISSVIDNLLKKKVTNIHIIPLFPQYASASTGSVVEEVMNIVKSKIIVPEIKFTNRFCEKDLFIDGFVENAHPFIQKTQYDHFVFSYHGIPERQILKGSVSNYCQLGECCKNQTLNNAYCYRAQCFETTKLLVQRLNIKEEDYTICFQSRLGKTPWIKPYTDKVLEDLAKKGIKKVLAFSPSFVADCLETTVEVGITYKEDFIEAGGEQWDMVPSLNTSPKWVACLKDLVING